MLRMWEVWRIQTSVLLIGAEVGRETTVYLGCLEGEVLRGFGLMDWGVVLVFGGTCCRFL